MDKNTIKIQPLNKTYFEQFTDLFTYYLKNEVGFYFLDRNHVKHNILENKIFKQLENNIIYIDIALIENSVKGFIFYQIDNEKSDWNERTGHGFIREFFVKQDSRQSGIGSTLISNAEKKLRAQGVQNIYLTANGEYTVEDFYYRHGYRSENKLCKKNNNEYFSKEL